jgi:predicted HTH domain antitoxin
MSRLQLDVPDEILISLKHTPESLASELRLVGAIKLYEMGKLSSGRAAQLAGMSRIEFLMLIGRYGVSPFSSDAAELARDVENA